MAAQEHAGLLGPNDPDPVEVVHPSSPAEVVLVCEHAGRHIPCALDGLGISDQVLNSHRGWDIGAAAVARRLAAHLNAPLVLQRYSRLVIDANRPPGSATSIPAVSHGADIPANCGLSDADTASRVSEILRPMDRAIEQTFHRHPRRAAFSVHSYTPELGGTHRPWHAGMLTRRSPKTAERLLASLRRDDPDLTVALNQPYRIEDDGDWFIPHHVEPRDLPHSLIEIRNDEIADDAGADRWAGLLATAITDVLEELT
ncbi:MAG: N-formylglutamate amidohydrolase [Pseudomonadota bacterium]